MASVRVMVVEDDQTLLGVASDYLRAQGYDVTAYADGREAQRALRVELPDILILDRMLPGVSGDVLCRDLRRDVPDLPIIMVTALGAVEHRIGGLEVGADDYLAKPFSLRELQLRIEALLRRVRAGVPAVGAIEVGPFRLDPVRRRISVEGRDIDLTGREYELLAYLLHHPDRVVTREEILTEVWGWAFGEASTVTVHVRRLREKIEREPRYPEYLMTEWGSGYRMNITGMRDVVDQ
ncbi:MAG TPA: response regulator transcription factor [Nocardioides sp.]|nr:response regulator transcription factor [Nocardioides sp.]